MRRVALSATGAQHFDEAIEIAKSIREEHRRAVALSGLAAAFARAGDDRADGLFDEARDLALSTVEEYERANAWDPSAATRTEFDKVVALVRNGRYDEAGEMARSISDYEWSAFALSVLSLALARAGDGRATAVVDEAANILRSRKAFDILGALTSLTTVLTQSNDQRADQVIERGIKVVSSLPKDRDWSRSVLDFTVALVRAGRTNEAREAAGFIQNEILKAEAQSEAAKFLAETGRFAAAQDVAREIQRDVQRAEALSSAAAGLARAGRFEEAHEVALSVARGYNKTLALIALAGPLAKAGEESADKIFAEAGAEALAIDEEPLLQAAALSELAIALAHAQRFEHAASVISHIPDPYEWSRAACALAESLLQRDPADDEQAEAWFDEVRRLAAHLRENAWGEGRLLRVLAETLGRVGRVEATQEVIALAEPSVDAEQQVEGMRDNLADSLARSKRFGEALTTLSPRTPDEFLQTLIKWSPSFEQVEPGLSPNVLREAIGVVGWLRPEWREIHELLSSPG